jgi:hypothetical protein
MIEGALISSVWMLETARSPALHGHIATAKVRLMPIPKKLQPHIDAAFPAHYLTMGTVLANGYAQITPRGSTQVYDDNHLSIWERGIGATAAEIHDGSKVTFYYSNFDLREQGMAFVRLYGRAKIHRFGPDGCGSASWSGRGGRIPRRRVSPCS